MKKGLLIILTLLFLSGCTDVKDKNYKEIIASSFSENYKYVNVYREGYNYYLPMGLKIVNNVESSDVITDNNYNYYLYVDRISYHNKLSYDYVKENNAYYSDSFTYAEKSGYLEINGLQNDKYLIEIMYNYAKIEVIVDKNNINKAISYSAIILSSIKYNDNIIANLIETGATEFKEEEYNIFSTVSNDSNVLQFRDDYTPQDDSDLIPDTDLIN